MINLFFRARTPERDYWWYEVAADGTINPFDRPSFASLAPYARLAPGEGSVAALVELDSGRLGLLLFDLPSGQQDTALRPTRFDLLISSDQRGEILTLAHQFARHWPMPGDLVQRLRTLVSAATRAGVQVLEARRAGAPPPRFEDDEMAIQRPEPEPAPCVSTAPPPDTKPAGTALRAYLQEALARPWTPPNARASIGGRLLAGNTTERIEDVLGWLHGRPVTGRPHGEALIVAAPRVSHPPPSWHQFPYLLTSDGPAEWITLPEEKAPELPGPKPAAAPRPRPWPRPKREVSPPEQISQVRWRRLWPAVTGAAVLVLSATVILVERLR